MSRPLLAALGRAGISFVGAAPRLGDVDESVDLSEITMQIAGGAAVAAGAAAAFGCQARLATQLAGDALGRFALEALDRCGVDVRTVRVDDDSALSPLAFAAVTGDRRVAFHTTGDAGPLAPEDVHPSALLDGAAALILDGGHPRAAAHVAEIARERDVPVVFDGTEVQEGTGELIALADVLIGSERLASELAPRGELQDSLVELQRMGPRAVIITLGDAGSIGLHSDQLVEQPAFEVPVTDTADAGDVYHGAFATALVNGLPFVRCMEFASAAAALSCRELGAWAGVPTRDEIVSLIQTSRAER